MEILNPSIILIGPPGAGKSTVAEWLAGELSWEWVCLDEIRYNYYYEIGYDDEEAGRIYRQDGFWGLYRYWKPFEIHAVERLLADTQARSQPAILDFGAGHSIYDDPQHLERARRALEPFPNVALLLPDADPDLAVRLLYERFNESERVILGLNEYFVKHPANRQLAKIVIYNQGRTPEQTGREIISRLSLLPANRPEAG